MIAQLIAQYAASQAAAGDWTAVAAAVNAQSFAAPGNRISGKATIVGLSAAGIDPDRIRTVFEATPSGRGLLGLLDAGTTVDWIDPVTVATLAKNTGSGKLSETDVLALKSLSRLVPVVTAEQCSVAWASHMADVAAQQAAAVRSARVAGVRSLDAETIIDQSANLDAAVSAIRASLTAFGGW